MRIINVSPCDKLRSRAHYKRKCFRLSPSIDAQARYLSRSSSFSLQEIQEVAAQLCIELIYSFLIPNFLYVTLSI